MEPGAYAFCLNVPVGKTQRVNIPIDVVIQPKKLRTDRLPIRIEARSAGDFTNKRRKEEATQNRRLQATYGKTVAFVLFLCGYFGNDYLGCAEGDRPGVGAQDRRFGQTGVGGSMQANQFCVKWSKINLAQRIDTPFGIQPSGACGDMRYPSPRAAESVLSSQFSVLSS
ncbi:hypothetical protein Rcas_2225 [Roseiflexus castenholzii DSM 13941]|jgi:hypothetical protein|uniref:Uncharacterized protein n=1 Tax=Roseiflexus castenholzii (strain DSM 13941 / HLO8) TaxID=383372 RepID=A7NLC5_ROSCS|nr:hypothetical protein Rcas_2225 [Roseiflexus castenholzii DSM 13941]